MKERSAIAVGTPYCFVARDLAGQMSLVIEGFSGHYPLGPGGPTAKAVADELNAHLGLPPSAVADIILSSFEEPENN